LDNKNNINNISDKVGIIDFLNNIEDDKKYLLSPLINYCDKLHKNETDILKNEKKDSNETKIRNFLSHYYHKIDNNGDSKKEYSYINLLNEISKIDNLPIEIFNIAFNKIISDFRGSINKKNNEETWKKEYFNIFKASYKFKLDLVNKNLKIKLQNKGKKENTDTDKKATIEKEISETFIDLTYNSDRDKTFRINAKFLQFLVVIDSQNKNYIDSKKSYTIINGLKNDLINLYNEKNKKSKKIIGIKTKTIGEKDLRILKKINDNASLNYDFDLYKNIDKLEEKIQNIKKQNEGKIEAINENIRNYLDKKINIEYKSNVKDNKLYYCLDYKLQLKDKYTEFDSGEIKFAINLGKKSFDVKNSNIEYILDMLKNNKKILDVIIYNEYIANKIESVNIDVLKNKIDENMKNNYARGIKLIKQIFEFEKEFFDETKMSDSNNYLDFSANNIKKEDQELIKKIINNMLENVTLNKTLDKIKLLRNMAMHFDVPIRGSDYKEINNFIIEVLQNCPTHVKIKDVNKNDAEVNKKITVLKNFALALMEFLGVKSEYRKFLEEYWDYGIDIEKNKIELKNFGIDYKETKTIKEIYKWLERYFYKIDVVESICKKIEVDNIIDLKNKINGIAIDDCKNEKLKKFLTALKMLLKNFKDKNDKTK
jgi:hypothetical protein